MPRDSAGNIDPKGFAIEGSVAPGSDYNPPFAPASLYGGVSTTSVNCILGCKDAGNKGVTDLISNEISSTSTQSQKSQQSTSGNNNKPSLSANGGNQKPSMDTQNNKNSWWKNWWSKTQNKYSKNKNKK